MENEGPLVLFIGVIIGFMFSILFVFMLTVPENKVTDQKPFELDRKIYQCKQVKIKHE